MAKRPSKRRFNLRPVRVNPFITVGALASKVVVVGAVTPAADGQYRAITMKQVFTLRGNTAGNGPMTVGYAHDDYSVTEIKEAIEAAAAISLGDMVAREQSNRKVRIIGTFPGLLSEETLNDGRPVSTKLNWAIPIGKAVNIFVYNEDGSTRDTGGIVDATGTIWVKDY